MGFIITSQLVAGLATTMTQQHGSLRWGWNPLRPPFQTSAVALFAHVCNHPGPPKRFFDWYFKYFIGTSWNHTGNQLKICLRKLWPMVSTSEMGLRIGNAQTLLAYHQLPPENHYFWIILGYPTVPLI